MNYVEQTGVGRRYQPNDATRAQSDPWGVLYDDIANVAHGGVPSRQDIEATIVACAVIAAAAPEVVAALVTIAALVEGLAWLASKLGSANYCDNPPSGPDDPRWGHFEYFWPNGIPNGPWSNPLPGSFEAWALPVMKMNFEYLYSCRACLDYRELLPHLVTAWNGTHSPNGSEITVSTLGYNLPNVTDVNGNPLSKWPMVEKFVVSDTQPAVESWQTVTAVPGMPGYWDVHSNDSDITINRGSFLEQPQPPACNPLTQPFCGQPIVVTPGKTSSTAAKVATGAAVAGGGVVLAAFAVSWVKGRSLGWVFEKGWQKVKGAFR